MIQQESSTVEAAIQTTTVGRSLREQRIARGLSIEDVSARTKYSARQIQALEEERWDQLPSGVSLRGMIRNYAKLVGVETDSLIASLSGHAAVADRPTGRELGASAAVGGDTPASVSSMSWGWLLAILVVIIAVAAYAFWRGWLPRELLTLSGIKQYFHR